MGIEDRKQREFNRREQDILEAAFDLFADKGIENVTIDMIAQAAEIGKGTIYKHFKSKHEIYARLIMDRGAALHLEIAAIDPGLPILDKLKKVFELYAGLFFKDQKALAVFNQCEALLTPEFLGEEMLVKVDAMHTLKTSQLDALFKQGIEEGVFIDTSPETLRILATGMFTGTMNQLMENPVDHPKEIIRTMERVFLNGILK